MPQHHHQTFDQSGNIIEERIEEYDDPQPSPKDTAKERLRSANSVAALRTAVIEYIEAPDEGL